MPCEPCLANSRRTIDRREVERSPRRVGSRMKSHPRARARRARGWRGNSPRRTRRTGRSGKQAAAAAACSAERTPAGRTARSRSTGGCPRRRAEAPAAPPRPARARRAWGTPESAAPDPREARPQRAAPPRTARRSTPARTRGPPGGGRARRPRGGTRTRTAATSSDDATRSLLPRKRIVHLADSGRDSTQARGDVPGGPRAA